MMKADAEGHCVKAPLAAGPAAAAAAAVTAAAAACSTQRSLLTLSTPALA
jgi:hypothetical protein